MQILYSSLHNLDLAKDSPIRKKIPSDFTTFMDAYVEFATTENKNSREYVPIDPNRTVLRCVSSIYTDVLDQDDEVADDTELVELTDSIALMLLTVEKNVQERIAQLTEVQKGSIVQALLKDEDTYQYVIAKVEHSEWIDGETLEMNLGFPGKNKKVWKSAVINLSLGDDEVIFDSIRVYVDHPAKYWSDEFLEVKEAKTDSKNTKAVFHAFEQALKPIKNVSLGDYYNIKNSVVHDLQSDQDINYNDLVEKTIDHYQPLSDEVDLSLVKEKLIAAGEGADFDTQFHTDPEAIKTAGRIKIHVSPAIDVTVKEGLSNWRENFRTYKKSDGRTYIMIKCDDQETLRMFPED
jgi:hypothetical protein